MRVPSGGARPPPTTPTSRPPSFTARSPPGRWAQTPSTSAASLRALRSASTSSPAATAAGRSPGWIRRCGTCAAGSRASPWSNCWAADRGACAPTPPRCDATSRRTHEAARLVRLRDEQGFDAFKWRVGAECGHDVDEWPGRTEAVVPVVARALGAGMAKLVDANSGFSPPRAIEVGQLARGATASAHYEEPCPYWKLEETRARHRGATSWMSPAASRTGTWRPGHA